MMDAKLTAAAPNPDLKIQIKQQGGKSDKGALGEGRTAFRNALDERVGARDNAPGRIAIKTATERLQEQRALQEITGTVGMQEAEARETPAPQLKPLIHLPDTAKVVIERDLKPEPPAIGRDRKPETPANNGHEDKVFKEKNVKSAHGPVKTERAEARREKMEGDGADQTPVLSDMADAPDEPQVEKAVHRKGKFEEKVAEPTDDGATNTPDAAAQDALVLLKHHDDNRDASASATPPAHAHGNPHDESSPDDPQSQGRAAVYRITRADGRGQMVEIEHPLGKDVGEKSGLAKAEVNNVVVVEQRRFLAPAADNALSIAANIAGDSEWARALQPDQALANAASQAGGGKVVNTLKIQLHPIDLGLVTATLRLTGDELSVELKVDTGVAYRSLKDDQTRIVEALKAHGFAVDQVNVSFGADRSEQQPSNSQNGQASGFAQQQQQQARDGGQNAPAARERPHYERQRNGNGTASGDDLRVETGSNGSAGSGRPGHVYI